MRIEKLDGLRGLLCIGILVFHYQQNEFCFGNHFPSFIADFFLIKQSYTFVDFFFALSGFVISLNYNENIDCLLYTSPSPRDA